MSASFLGNLRLRRALSAAVASVTACATLASFTPDAAACGCTSPPVPTVNETSFAVNQQSEQIIFEVEPGFVTAHVLIRYVGDPSQFAWLVPVPAVPELDLSESALFGLLDGASSPLVNAPNVNRCPSDVYTCEHHPPPDCYDPNQPPGGSTGPGRAPGRLVRVVAIGRRVVLARVDVGRASVHVRSVHEWGRRAVEQAEQRRLAEIELRHRGHRDEPSELTRVAHVADQHVRRHEPGLDLEDDLLGLLVHREARLVDGGHRR